MTATTNTPVPIIMTTTPPSTTPRVRTLSVLVADKFEQSGLDGLAQSGARVESRPGASAEDLPALLAELDPDVLIVRSTKVKADAFASAARLSLVVRAGAGVDNIDLAAASKRGVFVANCPGRNAIAVAELAWGHIIGCDRRLPDQAAELRAGRWNKKEFAKARGLHGRTLGVLGLGQIGEAVVARGLAFGMRVIAWSRSLTDERAEALGVERAEDPLALARASDVVSVNVAATAETRHLVDATFLAALRDGAILVNTSRGSVVDEAALAEAVRTRGLRAGLDVWDPQPGATEGPFANPIVREAGVYGSHHCGASTDQAQQAIAAETVRIVRAYAARGEVPNCVNLHAASDTSAMLTIRHLNRPGVLAHAFRVLSESEINVEEMENILYDGADAACARIRLDRAPGPEQVAVIRTNPHVLSVVVRE